MAADINVLAMPELLDFFASYFPTALVAAELPHLENPRSMAVPSS
jgi:hypothetical protein